MHLCLRWFCSLHENTPRPFQICFLRACSKQSSYTWFKTNSNIAHIRYDAGFINSKLIEISSYIHGVSISFWQLWTVVLWIIQPMAKLITLLEQHLDRQPPTIVIQAITWLETVLVLVNLLECGVGVNLPVKVYWYACMCTTDSFGHLCMTQDASNIYKYDTQTEYDSESKNSCTDVTIHGNLLVWKLGVIATLHC